MAYSVYWIVLVMETFEMGSSCDTMRSSTFRNACKLRLNLQRNDRNTARKQTLPGIHSHRVQLATRLSLGHEQLNILLNALYSPWFEFFADGSGSHY